jgi:hypothetical protein
MFVEDCFVTKNAPRNDKNTPPSLPQLLENGNLGRRRSSTRKSMSIWKKLLAILHKISYGTKKEDAITESLQTHLLAKIYNL